MIQYHQITNSDYSPIYYTLVAYNRAVSVGKYFFRTDCIFEANMIVDGVYLGNINSVYDFDQLKANGITHIISAIAGFNPPSPLSFQYLVIDALDSTNSKISDCFESCNSFIKTALDNDGKVLVHCMAGRSRSAAIVGGFLIHQFGMSSVEAVSLMQTKRPIVQPNESFMIQLEAYNSSVFIDK